MMNTNPLKHEIALWGPSGSGKTWLMEALGKALFNMNQQDPEFDYTLSHPDGGGPVHVFNPPKHEGTEDAYNRLWVFTRKGKQGKTSAAHCLSAHTHIISIADAPGIRMIAAVENAVMVPIQDAQCVILMLAGLADSLWTGVRGGRFPGAE
jgi:GTPase SAR1 family protein